MVAVKWPWIAAALALLVAGSCSSDQGPRSGVTLLVTNSTCSAGPCQSVEVLGFPGTQPATPGGAWSLDLGPMSGAQVCLAVPPSAKFLIIGPGDTTTITWTNAKALSLGTITSPSQRLMAEPDTKGFVPAAAAGWGIALPGDSEPIPAPTCSS